MKAFKICIKGKVQGVFYRASTLQKAKSLSLKGIVKNCDDGSVEIIAEGDYENIFELIEWSKKGPAGSIVTEVIFKEIFSQNFSEFKIAY